MKNGDRSHHSVAWRSSLARPAPTWGSVSRFATTAEEIGFDSFVFEDALLYRGAEETQGSWESVSIAAALATTTSRIKIGQSVVNAPYRSPALIAKTAETLDEISGALPLRPRRRQYR